MLLLHRVGVLVLIHLSLRRAQLQLRHAAGSLLLEALLLLLRRQVALVLRVPGREHAARVREVSLAVRVVPNIVVQLGAGSVAGVRVEVGGRRRARISQRCVLQLGLLCAIQRQLAATEALLALQQSQLRLRLVFRTQWRRDCAVGSSRSRRRHLAAGTPFRRVQTGIGTGSWKAVGGTGRTGTAVIPAAAVLRGMLLLLMILQSLLLARRQVTKRCRGQLRHVAGMRAATGAAASGARGRL